jgi:hypothetical protein
VIEAYGGHCACCGESTIEFLELDHVNNDGKADRAKHSDTYKRAKDLNYPPCYQVLCSNCNQAKARYGVCPHQKGAPHYILRPRSKPRPSTNHRPLPFTPPSDEVLRAIAR